MCFASKTVNRAVSSVLIMCHMHCSSHKKIYKINNLVQQLRSFTIIILFELYERKRKEGKKKKKRLGIERYG
jgi:hypothetical protein